MTKQNWRYKMHKKDCVQLQNPMTKYWVVINTKLGAIVRHRKGKAYKNITIKGNNS